MATRFQDAKKQSSARVNRQNGVNRAQQADFEELLSDLSAAFVRVSVDEIDNEVERCLERVVLAMGIDRSTVIQIDRGDGAIYVTHQFAREGVSLDPKLAERLAAEPPGRSRKVKHGEAFPGSFPWLTRKVLAGEAVVISRLEELPPHRRNPIR